MKNTLKSASVYKLVAACGVIMIIIAGFSTPTYAAHGQGSGGGGGGGGMSGGRRDISNLLAMNTQGQVLGAEAVSPEIQARINQIKAQLIQVIQQLIIMLQEQIRTQRGW